MKRPGMVIVGAAFALGCTGLATPLLFAALGNPFGQDTLIWLALGMAAASSAGLALWSCVGRASLSTRVLLLRALVCLALALPAALVLGFLASHPP
jgi:hypothetical protein